EVEDPDRLGIDRVGEDVHVIPRPLPHLAALVDPLPGLAVVVRAQDRAVFRLDDCPDTARLGGRGGNANPAQHALGHTRLAGDLLPGVAAVGRAEEAGARPATDQFVRAVDALPEGGVDDARVG